MSDTPAGSEGPPATDAGREHYTGPFTIHDPAHKPSVFSQTRTLIAKNPTVDRVYKTGVGLTGAGAVALGVILIPLPGPGSLIALGGLAILGTEFAGAKKASGAANAAAKKAFDKAKEVRRTRRDAKAGKAPTPPQ